MNPTVSELVGELNEVREGAAQSVQLPYDKSIAGQEGGEGFGKFGPISLRTRRRLLENDVASYRIECIQLQCRSLLIARGGPADRPALGRGHRRPAAREATKDDAFGAHAGLGPVRGHGSPPAKAPAARTRLQLGLGKDDSAYIFDRADGAPWHPDAFSSAFARLVERSDVPRVRLHDLRHSHATIALAAGTDLKTISTALGHATIGITANVYLHAVESLGRSHADRIDAALSDSFASAVGSDARPVQQRCNTAPSITEKPRCDGVSMVAPTGVEPVSPP